MIVRELNYIMHLSSFFLLLHSSLFGERGGGGGRCCCCCCYNGLQPLSHHAQRSYVRLTVKDSLGSSRFTKWLHPWNDNIFRAPASPSSLLLSLFRRACAWMCVCACMVWSTRATGDTHTHKHIPAQKEAMPQPAALFSSIVVVVSRQSRAAEGLRCDAMAMRCHCSTATAF